MAKHHDEMSSDCEGGGGGGGSVSSIDGDSKSIDDEEGADVRDNKMCPEMPVPLFALCSGDRLTNDIISSWTIRLSDAVESSPLVLLQSNIWPGAFTFVKDR